MKKALTFLLLTGMLFLAGCVYVAPPKPTYECSSAYNATCESFVEQLQKECEGSLIKLSTRDLKMDIDITRDEDTCHLTYSISTSKMDVLENTSMVCAIPLKDTNDVIGDTAALMEYCEGSYVEMYKKYNAQD